MHVSLQRVGGQVFGMTQGSYGADTKNLDQEQAEKLEGLVEAVDFFNLPAELIGPNERDAFYDELTVDAEGRQHTVVVSGGQMTPGLAALRDWLTKHGSREG